MSARDVWVILRGGQYLQSHGVWALGQATARRFESIAAAHVEVEQLKLRYPNVKFTRQTIFE